MLPVHGLIIVELQPKINCNSTINLTKIRPLILWDLPKTLITAWSSAIILRTDLQKFLASIFKALLIGKPALQSPITGRARRLLSISASRLRSWTVTNCPSCRQKAQKTAPAKGQLKVRKRTLICELFTCTIPQIRCIIKSATPEYSRRASFPFYTPGSPLPGANKEAAPFQVWLLSSSANF